jgi:hypothetical protein
MSRGDIASGDSAGASSSGPSVPISALMDQLSTVLQRFDHLGQQMTEMRQYFGQ